MAPAAKPFIADFISLPPYTSCVIQPGVSGVLRTFFGEWDGVCLDHLFSFFEAEPENFLSTIW
jgi:hypothetical protein